MTNTVCGEPRSDDDPCQWDVDAKGPCPFHDDSKETPDNGREFSIDESDHDAILEAAEHGMSKAGCARAAGVSDTELGRYLDAHEDFRGAFMRARHKGEKKLVMDPLYEPVDNGEPAQARDLKQMDGQHARFLLSTSFDYKKTEKREITGEDGNGIVINMDD